MSVAQSAKHPTPTYTEYGRRPMNGKPAFLITIDTEGDNLWVKPRAVTTRNAEYLPRFQVLCERFGFSPTYLTNWEMVNCEFFREFGGDLVRRATGEIGMHLHAWDSPPLFSLTSDDPWHQPYLTEYPLPVVREKIRVITDRLQDVFQCRPVSHRAGRWALDENYVRALSEAGYQVDCSVTPHYSWRDCLGAPAGSGGSDYTSFPDKPYFPFVDDIRRPGGSTLLEVPVSILRTSDSAFWGAVRSAGRATTQTTRLVNRLRPPLLWPYPGIQSMRHLFRLLEVVLLEQRDYFMLVLHSSELMPGGSPRFSTAASIERLYEVLEALFAEASDTFQGMALCGFYQHWVRPAAPPPSLQVSVAVRCP